jgi:hypothetical protein
MGLDKMSVKLSEVTVKFTLKPVTKAKREAQLYSFFNLCARWEWVVNIVSAALPM